MGDLETEASTPLQARQYQLELLEYVTNNNGIIYLPTGAGKTYVAILALKRFSSQMGKTIAEGGKRAIFMCNTVELARQQAVEIRKHVNLKVGLYLGERDVDNWHSKKWKEEIDENQVLVGTVQIFVNIVSGNFIKITDLSIVVIDECHHGTKTHPMHEFMRFFQKVPNQALLPRVIGLTGVLLKGNKLNNIHGDLRALEVTFRANIVTITSRDEFLNVMIHSTSPDEKMILYASSYHRPNINSNIQTIVGTCLRVIAEFDLGALPVKLTKGLAAVRETSKKNIIKNMLNDLLYHLEEYGIYCTLFVLESIVIEFELKLRQSETVALRRMFRYVITQMEAIRHIIYACIKENFDEDDPTNEDCHKVDVILNYSTTKLVSLLKFVEQTFSGKDRSEISCLIFVDRRLTAKSICSVIQKFVNLKANLKEIIFPKHMVGRNAMLLTSVENILDKKWNNQVMTDFRKGACNMIVCSSVLEEGIDVQSCNFVIVFDPLKTFNSYIQTKGRARQKNAVYAYAVEKVNQHKTIEQIMKYQTTHEAIRSFLFERTLNTPHPNQEEIDSEFDNKIPPLVTPQGACLLASSALAMVNRYCQLLPWDAFGAVLPQYKKMPPNGRKGCVVSVKLPLQSCVKEEILSDPMESTKSAKLSAALKACRRLYEEGELNENLLPISKADVIRSISDVLFKHWEKHKDSDVAAKKEGKMKQRLYDKKCPGELYNSMPVLGKTCYAYEIIFTPDFEPNDYNAHIVQAFKSKTNYALLLRKPLPRLAEMPLFMQQGSLKVRIAEKPLEFCINSEEKLQQLRQYHLVVMRDLLECWHTFYVEDKRNKHNAFLIAPIFCGSIDWNIVQKFQCLQPLVTPSLNERQNGNYRAEDWLGKIVGKWYSPESRERFIVTKVLTDHSPSSPFPHDKQGDITYAQFFQTRYGTTVGSVQNQTQFLIEAKPLTSRRNFFNNAKSKDSVIKRDSQQVVLLPELCHNFQHPGDLWLKALFLPSIFHRLHYMLHAEHIRNRINAFLGLTNSFKDYKPKSLIIDRSLRRAVDSEGNACGLKREEPILLPSLTPSSHVEIGFEVLDMTAVASNELWKAYMEPRNLACQSTSIFPVEIDYFHNFTQQMQANFEMVHSIESGYVNQQFEMPKIGLSSPAKNVSNCVNHSLVPALEDVSVEDKRRIKILDRSISSNSVASKMESAEQYEFLAAITTSAANDVFDMERFELLGDSFLKFSVSLYLANKFPNLNEGFLTHLKSKLVSNRNLLYCLLETDIPTRICSSSFLIHEWLPPLISLPENLLTAFEKDPMKRLMLSSRDLYRIKMSEEEIKSGRCNEKNFLEIINACKRDEVLTSDGLELNESSYLNYCTYKDLRADKNVADTLEALLGVCVKNYGFHMSFRMLEFFGIIRNQPGDKPLTNLLDLKLGGNQLKTEISTRDIDAFLVNHQYLERNLGYRFRDRSYLLQALTHPSFPTNRLTGCYQELEFIGDAILDVLVSSYIFERHESKTPGMLTDLRSALVNNIVLGCICVRHRFHLFLLAENAVLAESIRKFCEFQETQNYAVTDQVYILMDESDTVCSSTSNISVNVEVPKVLGDIVEALIAAVYLDSRSLQTTWEVIYRMLGPELHKFGEKVPIDPVRRLYEHPSAKPHFSDPIVNNDATLVRCEFSCLNKSVVVNGFGVNKHQAKKSAAKHALQILERA